MSILVSSWGCHTKDKVHRIRRRSWGDALDRYFCLVGQLCRFLRTLPQIEEDPAGDKDISDADQAAAKKASYP